MKLKANARNPLTQTVRAATSQAAAPQTDSAHFQRSRDFRQMFEVDLERVFPRADQPRRHFDEGELQSLAASIMARGVLQPILVRKRAEGDDDYEIVAGERRWRASRLAGKDRIRAIIVDGDAAEIALIENMQRVDLTALEEAAGIQALMDSHGYAQGQVAEILGRSRVRVNETLRILSLPADILACLTSDNAVPRSTLLQIAREEDPVLQRKLWEQARSGAGEKAIRAARPRARHTQPTQAGARFLDSATRLSRALPPANIIQLSLSDQQRRELAALRDLLDSLLARPA